LSVITSLQNIVRVIILGEKRPADVGASGRSKYTEENCKAKTQKEA
jgi:hypothetical protein